MQDSAQDAIIVLPDKIELSGSQAKAFLEALKDLKDCRDKVIAQDEIISGLKSEIKNLQENQEILFNLYQKSKPKEPGHTSQDRAKRLDTYMDARPDHKASYEALKGFLEVNDVLLNQTIAALMKDQLGKYARSKDEHDKRKRWLVRIPEMV